MSLYTIILDQIFSGYPSGSCPYDGGVVIRFIELGSQSETMNSNIFHRLLKFEEPLLLCTISKLSGEAPVQWLLF